MSESLNLKQLLRPNLVKLHVSVDNWQDAIRAVGQLLVDDKAVEPRFVDAMIRVAKEFGPYIVLAPGFAMPHARPEDGCIRSSIALITLTNPVEFGNKENDPVNVVVALASTSKESHITGLSELATVMSEEGMVEKLAAAETIQDVLKIMWSQSE